MSATFPLNIVSMSTMVVLIAPLIGLKTDWMALVIPLKTVWITSPMLIFAVGVAAF